MNPASTAGAARSPRRGGRRALILLAAAALLAAGGYVAWPRLFGPHDELAQYVIATAERGDIEDLVTATGTLQPRDYVDVGAQVSGQLTHIHVEVGSEVKKGDLLAEIDPRVYKARVDASAAQLRNLQAQLADREAQLTLAQLQYTRQKNLMAADATTAEALQTADATLRSARAQIAALKAQIDQTESSLRADQASLDYARIYAPMTGSVVSITARQGQTLNANQQAPIILRIADLSTMTVQTQVSEADVGKLRPGMEVYFNTLGGQDHRWYGTLAKIEPTPAVENNVVLYNALFDVPNPDGRLMTQMTAQVFFVAAAAKDAVLVPMSALGGNRRGGRHGAGGAARAAAAGAPTPSAAPARRAGGGDRPARHATLRVVRADGTLEERSVELGIANRIQAQIVSGLQPGERVVAGLAGAPAGAPRPAMRAHL